MSRLTDAQRYMLNTLREDGPLDVFTMRAWFGRQWGRTWSSLKHKGLARFDLNPKDAKHYAYGPEARRDTDR